MRLLTILLAASLLSLASAENQGEETSVKDKRTTVPVNYNSVGSYGGASASYGGTPGSYLGSAIGPYSGLASGIQGTRVITSPIIGHGGLGASAITHSAVTPLALGHGIGNVGLGYGGIGVNSGYGGIALGHGYSGLGGLGGYGGYGGYANVGSLGGYSGGASLAALGGYGGYGGYAANPGLLIRPQVGYGSLSSGLVHGGADLLGGGLFTPSLSIGGQNTLGYSSGAFRPSTPISTTAIPATTTGKAVSSYSSPAGSYSNAALGGSYGGSVPQGYADAVYGGGKAGYAG